MLVQQQYWCGDKLRRKVKVDCCQSKASWRAIARQGTNHRARLWGAKSVGWERKSTTLCMRLCCRLRTLGYCCSTPKNNKIDANYKFKSGKDHDVLTDDSGFSLGTTAVTPKSKERKAKLETVFLDRGEYIKIPGCQKEEAARQRQRRGACAVALASEGKGRDADRSERDFSPPLLTTQETAANVGGHQVAENS